MTWRVISEIKFYGPIFVVALVSTWYQSSSRVQAQEPDKPRPAWTTSQVKGSPDEPLPLALVPAFPKLKFNDPMHV